MADACEEQCHAAAQLQHLHMCKGNMHLATVQPWGNHGQELQCSANARAAWVFN